MENLELLKNHPLRSAQWIWPGGYMNLHNHFAQFRRDFTLDQVPEKAPFFITADHSYRLYVNGQYICRGPARGYQAHWPFDEVDLASVLKEGHNWISVEAYNPGISTFSYVHQTSAGLLCAAKWGDFEFYSNDEWLFRRSPAHKTNTSRLSMQLCFQEHVDTSELYNSWIYSSTPPAPEWTDAKDPVHCYTRVKPFGQSPYFDIEPRQIPMLRENFIVPQKVCGCTSNKCESGYRDWENISWEFIDESENSNWTKADSIACQQKDEYFELTIPASGKDNFSAVTIDIGKEVIGTLKVQIDKTEADGIVDFHYTEGLKDNQPGLCPKGGGCQIALANRLFLSGKPVEHEFFQPIGFHYLTVVARNICDDLTLKLSVKKTEYPFSFASEFYCSDDNLNEIREICRHTQQICSIDAYVDTPWREQAQWWGDARVQAKNTFFIDGDARLLKRGIRSISGQICPVGLTFGHAPTSAHNCILPDFSLTWILTIWDYYWQTGDSSLIQELWPKVEKVLSYFDRPEVKAPCGLLIHDKRFWYFGDWAKLYRGYVPSFLNLWYLLTLEKLSELLKTAGMTKEAGVITSKAKFQRKLVFEKLYNPETKLVAGGLDENEKQVEESSVHDQTMAIILNLVPDAKQDMLDKKLVPYIKQQELEGAVPSAFWCTYTMEVLQENGFEQEVIDFIKTKWNPMLSTGSTWESFDWYPGCGGSASHAWSAHPCYHLVNILGGITQRSAGWQEVNIKPFFPEAIDYFTASVPSPAGEIKVDWKRDTESIQVNITLPEKVTATIELPGINETVSGKSLFTYQVQV
jgi:hypothetical protein